MQKALLAAALAVGLLLTYVDSLPTWDETGITAFALLLSAGVIGLFVRRRPWLFGLAIGLWIPLRGVLLAHDFRFLIVLLFPLAGVYAGWALGRQARKLPESP
jgi:hypothetical protein